MKLRYVHDILDTFLTHSWHTFLAHVLDTRSPPVRAICDFVLSVTVVILIQVLQECLLQIRGPERSDDEDDEEQESEEERKYLLMPFLATLPVFPPFPSPCVPRLSPFPPSHPLSPFFLLSCFCFLWCTSNAGCAVESISYIWTYLFLTGEKKKAERLQKLLDVSKVLISILLNSFGKHQYPSPQWVLTHEI